MEGFAGANMGNPGDIGGAQYDVPPADPYTPVETQSVQMQPMAAPNQGKPQMAPQGQPGEPRGKGLLLAGLCGAAGIALGMMFAKRK